MDQVPTVGLAVVEQPATTLTWVSERYRITLPIVAVSVAALLATEAIRYQPGSQLVPDLTKRYFPTSPAAKL